VDVHLYGGRPHAYQRQNTERPMALSIIEA
jgi:hypothetical protein